MSHRETSPNEDDIRVRAYHRYLERGPGQGSDFDDWLEAEKALTGAIRSAADTRAGDDPDDVITLLADLKAELAYLPHSWPNRTWIAAARLAEVADDPLPWLHASIRRGFMPEGCAFAERCPIARPRCSQERPPLDAPMPGSAHRAACFFPGELSPER